MANETLRRNMDRAFDPGPDFPDRLLLSRTMASLDAAAKIGGHGRERRGIAWPSRPIGLRMTAGLVAILFVVAVTAGAVLAIVLAHTHSAPARYPTPIPYSIPPPPSAKDGCSAHPRQWASSPANPAKMLNSTTGWAYGPMRTTDGGLHWVDVSPPSVPGRTPTNDEFFLDGMHAWVAETVSSSAACVDQVVVFRTVDAGKTWQQSAPISVRSMDLTDLLWTGENNHIELFDFVDGQHGWLLLGSGSVDRSSAAGVSQSWVGAAWRIGDLYRTTDGGSHWTHVVTNPGSEVGCLPTGTLSGLNKLQMSFSSQTTGWMTSSCGLLVTHDTGSTWVKASTPLPAAESPVFFDATHGAVLAAGRLLETSNGGATWTVLPGPTTFIGVDFITPSEGWAVGGGASPGPVECSPQNMDVCNGNFQLYRTRDGGKTWVPAGTSSLLEPAPKYWPPAYLHFFDSEIGFLDPGGDTGYTPTQLRGLFKTTDGGRTWIRVDGTVQRP